MSLLEYYIAPAIQEKQGPYRMIRNAGVNQQRIELAEYHMLKFFPNVTREEYENNKEEVFFKDLLYLLNEVALMGELPDEAGKISLMNKVAIDCQIQNLAADCHWAMLVFTVGHEIAHIYQMNTNRIYWEEHLKEAEFNADKIGYDILLHLIMGK